jgi:hypothetical protein
MAAATTTMAALNSATSSNAIDPNAEDNCDDAETGNAQESNGYDELPELQAVVIDRALHDDLTAAIAWPGPLPTITGRDNCRGRSYVLLAHGLRVSSRRSG